MKFELRSKGVRMTDELRNHVERHLGFALRRFGDRVQRVRVRLQDINGPRGGEDIQCQIHATMAPRGDLVIQELRADPFAAVARASDRVGHAISRQVDRMHSRRKARR